MGLGVPVCVSMPEQAFAVQRTELYSCMGYTVKSHTAVVDLSAPLEHSEMGDIT